MAGVGGYQAPGTPAPVSGPGALSQRTDVQAPLPVTGGAYGESQYFEDIQRGADLYADPGPAPAGLMDPAGANDGPLTSGIPTGPGPGPEVLSSFRRRQDEMASVSKYLPIMEKMAGSLDAPQAFRALVQFMKANQIDV